MKVLTMVVLFLVIGSLTVGLGGYLLMLLWNWLAVGIFGAPALTFLQACGIWFLLGLIGNLFR